MPKYCKKYARIMRNVFTNNVHAMTGQEFDFILRHSGYSFKQFAKDNEIDASTLYRMRTADIVPAVYVNYLEKICKSKQFEELRNEYKKRKEAREEENDEDEDE